MTKILITGASGLLGSHILRLILEESKFIPVVLVRSQEKAKFWENFGIETLIGDLEKCQFVFNPNEISTVIHTAAVAGDWVDKNLANQVNIAGTEYLLEQSVKGNVKTFIHVSTIGVYGHTKYHNVDETRKYKKSAHYENTKIEAERKVLEYKDNYTEISFFIFRPPSMYGPGDRHVIPKYEKYLRNGKFLFIGSGKHLYPILHASDAAKAILFPLRNQNLNSDIYNISDDSEITFKEFISILRDNLDLNNSKIRSIPYPVAYIVGTFLELLGKIRGKEPFIFRKRVKYLGISRHVSINKLKHVLGSEWNPIHPKDGIPLTLEMKQKEQEFNNVDNNSKIIDVIPFHLVDYFIQKQKS